MSNGYIKSKDLTTNNKYVHKNYPPSGREWKNSIYVFNKNALNLIPVTSNLAIKLIKSYLYIFSRKLDRRRKKKRILRRYRKLATTRIYTSKGEYKHTNNKVTITLNIYSKKNYNILRIIRKNILKKLRNPVKLKKRINKYSLKKRNFLKKNKKIMLAPPSTKLSPLARKKFFWRKKNIFFKKLQKNKLNFSKKLISWRKYLFLKKNIYSIKKNILKNAKLQQFIILKALKKNKIFFKNYKIFYSLFSNYLENFFFKFTRKRLKKFKLFFYYKQIYYINKSKFNYTYLQYLTSILHKLYNKNIEYNIIKLKYFYLNSDILSEIFTLKIRKNRRKTLRFLKKIIKKIKVGKPYISMSNSGIKNFLYEPVGLKDSYSTEKKKVLNLIKFKKLTGVRLEASGRLTRRYTASRSVYRYKYKGNLLNEESSYNNKSSVILKGNQISNLQYSFIKHNTRIGSFGIKGWISGN